MSSKYSCPEACLKKAELFPFFLRYLEFLWHLKPGATSKNSKWEGSPVYVQVYTSSKKPLSLPLFPHFDAPERSWWDLNLLWSVALAHLNLPQWGTCAPNEPQWSLGVWCWCRLVPLLPSSPPIKEWSQDDKLFFSTIYVYSLTNVIIIMNKILHSFLSAQTLKFVPSLFIILFHWFLD